MAIFQSKFYNPAAWGQYEDYLLRERPSRLVSSGVVVENARVARALATQTGSLTATLPYYSDGTEDVGTLNYDGTTDLTGVTPTTYSQTFGSLGRAKVWKETDFSIDLTTARSVDAVYGRLNNWLRYAIEQPMALNILTGLFTANTNQTAKTAFINAHTANVTTITPTDLNTALQKASGDYKDQFSLFVCGSYIQTQLENLQLLDYVKYTTPSGIETDLTLTYWGNKLLIVDDTVDQNSAANTYTGYALAPSVLTMQPLSVEHPIEPYRDPLLQGGVDQLIVRRRYAFGAKGFSFVPTDGAVNYTDAQLKAGTSWKLIEGADGNVIPHKEIPISRLILTLPTP
jgi:hypothetical protein